jgi:hypothetical protein
MLIVLASISLKAFGTMYSVVNPLFSAVLLILRIMLVWTYGDAQNEELNFTKY